MGMAASQVRFLSLQNRKNTVGLNLMTLSNRKLALSRDMNRIANEYNDAMNMKTLKWSGDSGITYSDLTYKNLMTPNDLNATFPYIITDAQGRVVLDDMDIELDGKSTGVSYRDLAMMISAYSGRDGETTYNNTANLSGGTNITATDIKNAEVGHDPGENKASSGKANELGYEIVSTASETGRNTLRYDLMKKLGLISEAEVDAITDLETELYGPKGDPNAAKFPVDSLMGQYYLALNNLQMFRDFKLAGDFEFATSNASTGDKEKFGTTYDGCMEEIKYKDHLSGTGTSISFDYESSYLSNLDLKGVNQTGRIGSSNLNYEIKDGKIEYSYTADTILNSMGNVGVGHESFEKTEGSQRAADWNSNLAGTALSSTGAELGDISGKSWGQLINSDYQIVIYHIDWDHKRHNNNFRGHSGDGDYSLPEQGKNNLEKYVYNMRDAFKSNISVEINQTAADKAAESTYHFFLGDITYDGKVTHKSYNRKRGAGNDRGFVRDNAAKGSSSQNLVNWTERPCKAVGDSKWEGRTIATVSAKNLYNTFITFYNYYYSQISQGIADPTTIVDKATAQNAGAALTGTNSSTGQAETETIPSVSGMSYTNSSVFTQNGTTYMIQEGTVDGQKCYDYYTCVQSGTNPDGTPKYVAKDLVQRVTAYSYEDEREDGSKYTTTSYEWTFYDRQADGSVGANAKRQSFDIENPADFDAIKKKVGALSGAPANSQYFEEESLWETSSSVSGGALTLTYKDMNGNDVTSVISTFNSGSTEKDGKPASSYSNSILGKPVLSDETLEELESAVDEAKAAVDEAEAEKAKYFDSTENKMMDYFDALFKMIAENGWVYDPSVNSGDTTANKNYLNAKLQNNMYFITEVDTLDGTDFNYATKIATNVSKVFEVYDKDAQNAALSKYEAEKADINAKEQQVDIRMNKLEAEQDAISTELDSIKKIIDDNVSVTFKIFT